MRNVTLALAILLISAAAGAQSYRSRTYGPPSYRTPPPVIIPVPAPRARDYLNPSFYSPYRPIRRIPVFPQETRCTTRTLGNHTYTTCR